MILYLKEMRNSYDSVNPKIRQFMNLHHIFQITQKLSIADKFSQLKLIIEI